MLEPIAYVGDIDQSSLVQVMSDDEVPRRTGGVQPIAVSGCNDPVAGRLVRVERQHVAVKVGRIVLEGSRHGWGGTVARGVAALEGRGRS